MTMLKLSVIIPVYNVGAYLRECLDSVLTALNGISSEIICVNDGSTDGSSAILKEYAAKSPYDGVDVVLVKQSNKGVSAARNAALDIARGEWICFVDGDDVWAPWAARNFLYLAALEDDLDIVQLTGKRFSENEPYPWVRDGDDGTVKEVIIQSDWVLRNRNIDRGFAKTCIRRKAIGGLRFTCRKFGEDRLFLIQNLLRARKVVSGVCDMYGYRTRVGSAIQSAMSIARIDDTVGYIREMFTSLKASGRKAEPNVYRIYLNKIIEEVPNDIQSLHAKERKAAWDIWREALPYFSENVPVKTWRQSLLLPLGRNKKFLWVVYLFGVFPYWLKTKGLHR